MHKYMPDHIRDFIDLSSPVGRFFAVVTATTFFAFVLAEQTVSQYFAAIILAGCVANAGRIAFHIYGGYLWLRPSKIRESPKPIVRQQLSSLMGANIVMTLSGIAGAIALYLHPEASFLCRLLPTLFLWAAYYWLALAIVDRANELDLPRGTEIVRDSTFGKWNLKIGRNGADFRPVEWLFDLFDNPTPQTKPSTTAVLIAGVLFYVPLTTIEIEVSRAGGRAVTSKLRSLFGREAESPASETAVSPASLVPTTGEAGGSEQQAPRQSESSLPDYSDLCGDEVWPGDGAPPSQRDELLGLWLGREATQERPAIRGAGAEAAGCARPAQPVVGQVGVWTVEGWCGNELRSLGVSSPTSGYEPGLVFQQAARFALAEAEADRLQGAWTRRNIGGGDFYVIDLEITPATFASFVLIREHKSLGSTTQTTGKENLGICAESIDRNASYTVVPATLIPLWQQAVASVGWVWPDDLDNYDPYGGDFVFHRTGSDQDVARATCTPEECSLWLGDEETRNATPILIRPGDILAMEETAPTSGSSQVGE